MGHSIRGFSAGHSMRYGLSRVQCIACEIPGTNQNGIGKAPTGGKNKSVLLENRDGWGCEHATDLQTA